MTYKRENTTVIMSGVTRDKVYLHVLNPLMGLNVIGKMLKHLD